ncbi:MAG: hypothetical protein ABIN89_26845 [Chitinophagaceae bacterium]
MKSISINSINFTLLKFIGFFTGSVILCVIIVSSFWGPLPAQSLQEDRVASNSNQNSFGEEQLLQTDQLLHSKWMRLEQIYSGTPTGKMVVEAEASFRKTLDSIRGNRSNFIEGNKIDSITSSFELVLKNRQSLNLINRATNNNNKDDSLMTQQMQNLQKDLQGKSIQLVKLQNQLKTKPVQSNGEAPQSSKETKKMKDEIEFLKWALRSEVSSNHALTNSNKQLKQENTSLVSQVKGR